MAATEATTMRKADLVKKVMETAGLKSRAEAEKAVDAVFDSITEFLKSAHESDKVSLTGFGVFEVTKQAGREGRNPATGKPIQIEERKRVRFRLGSELDAIR